MSDNNNFASKGTTFGFIVLGIIIFLLLWVYIYHHPANGIVFPD